MTFQDTIYAHTIYTVKCVFTRHLRAYSHEYSKQRHNCMSLLKACTTEYVLGLPVRTFEEIVISVVKFLVTCFVSEKLKEKYDTSHSQSCFIIRYFRDVTSRVDCKKLLLNLNEIFLNNLR